MLRPTVAMEDSGHEHTALELPVAAVSRRRMLTTSIAVAGAALTGMVPAFGETSALRATADDALGPFYPLTTPADHDFDLTVIAGRKGRALGQLLYVSGRVVNIKGEPVANALLEVWQANAGGRYAHPGDAKNKAALDPNFQGYAKIRTAADGSYRLKTIHPGEYDDRTRHIHFDIRGRNTRLITQLYFEGEKKNDTDPLLKLQTAEDKKTLLARPGTPSGKQERDALVVTWDIVLASG